mmetsp:Transcript_61341/g.194221  ORF Transcript_61341/g.194221 Transcript_61341/m.194221 type:complete len:188 (-) Transcript_61341:50-613(-)
MPSNLPPPEPSPSGDTCYFPRDLTRGSYGGGVNCLQQFLKAKGVLNEDPSGYFGEKTEIGLAKWQGAEGLKPAKGYLGLASRQLYAKKHGLPPPAQRAEVEEALDKQGVKKTCIDVCSEFNGVQDCQTRCVRSEGEKIHACREACQVAFSAACDRAYPPTADGGALNYKTCLQYLSRSCYETCAQYQ